MARYTVTAVWDPEARVYWSRSDIAGLDVEAETPSEFVDLVESLAPDLMGDNGLPADPVTITGEAALTAAS